MSHKLRQKVKVGAIVVLHPFSRDLSFKPHLHLLITEGGFDRYGKFSPLTFIPANAMRKVWQYEVLTNFKMYLPQTWHYSRLIDRLFKKYPMGFYVYLPKETRITNPRRIIKYVGRYVRHPAIANTRICDYDGKKVIFWYRDNQEKIHMVTMVIDEFISALIQHILDSHFKMIRYYGAYARRSKKRYRHYLSQRSIGQGILEDFQGSRSIPCPKCGSDMVLIEYAKKGPLYKLPFGSTLDHWNLLIPSPCHHNLS